MEYRADVEWRHSSDLVRGFPSRVELISAGRVGQTRAAYFAEWRALSQSVGGNGRLIDRSGRFEDLFIRTPVDFTGALSVSVGQFRTLTQVDGHIRYYGVPKNGPALCVFRLQVGRLWFRTLRRRSQRDGLSWARMRRHIDRWLPPARVCHPYPTLRAWRHSLRQEPDAGNPHVRICGGGAQ